jgi:hypothetical protein
VNGKRIHTRILAMLLATTALAAFPLALHASGRGERDNGLSAGISVCRDCHSSTSPKYGVLGTRSRYESSGHRTIGTSASANGQGCQKCHTNEGFIAYTQKGEPDPKEYIVEPSQPGCFTCHMPHEKGDFSLRIITPVTLANGKIFDVGHGNLCANCHKATTDAAKMVVAVPSNKIDADWGPHRGPQADIVRGTNAYEFPGKKYGSSAHKDILNDGCISCHMNLPVGRAVGLSHQVGGHSFQIAGETLNLSACNSCHRGVTQAPQAAVFNIIAQEDYDHNGKKEPYQLEVQGLLDQLVNKDGTGLLQSLEPPFYNADGSFHFVKSDAARSAAEVGALYNYRMIVNDRSLGIHNAKYVIQILYDSIQALDPQFDASKRPQ